MWCSSHKLLQRTDDRKDTSLDRRPDAQSGPKCYPENFEKLSKSLKLHCTVLTFFSLNENNDYLGWQPPCVLCTSLCLPCVPPFYASRTAYRLTTITTIFWRFHLHTEDNLTVCLHAHVQLFLQTLALMFLTSPNQVYVYKCSNDPQMHERSEHSKYLELFDFFCHVCCVSWWKLDL